MEREDGSKKHHPWMIALGLFFLAVIGWLIYKVVYVGQLLSIPGTNGAAPPAQTSTGYVSIPGVGTIDIQSFI